jgi:hypothetical protein
VLAKAGLLTKSMSGGEGCPKTAARIANPFSEYPRATQVDIHSSAGHRQREIACNLRRSAQEKVFVPFAPSIAVQRIRRRGLILSFSNHFLSYSDIFCLDNNLALAQSSVIRTSGAVSAPIRAAPRLRNCQNTQERRVYIFRWLICVRGVTELWTTLNGLLW